MCMLSQKSIRVFTFHDSRKISPNYSVGQEITAPNVEQRKRIINQPVLTSMDKPKEDNRSAGATSGGKPNESCGQSKCCVFLYVILDSSRSFSLCPLHYNC